MSRRCSYLPYVLITPAHNEEAFIERTIRSVLCQTVLPVKWVLVDDGSTDSTASIVGQYLAKYEWIEMIKRPQHRERNFAAKVAAFNAGVNRVKGMDYSFIGNLDADISLPPNYYEDIISEFERDPRLGIAGGIVYSKNGHGFTTDNTAPDSVAGAVQLFRKECFDQVGGYIPLENGGIDAAAEIIARMKGWKVLNFREKMVYQHRWTGSAQKSLLAARYRQGVEFHSLGYSTAFYLFRTIYRLKIDRPFLISGAVSLCGFLSARVRNCPISLPPEAVSYLRSEQAGKLRDRFFGTVARMFNW
jgi:glycosyltransferase involved in cell wall biosynthesis